MSDYLELQELADGVLDDSVWVDPDDDGQLPPNVTPIGSPEDENTPTRIVRHSHEFRQHVFRIWAFTGTRSAEKTSAIVRERDSVNLSPKTVRTWANADGWGEVADTLHQTFIETSRAQTAGLLSKLSVKAAEWALGAMDDPAVSDTVKAKMALGIWDRTGHVPMFGTSSQINVITNVGRDDLAGKSDAELQALAGGYMGDSLNVELPPFDVDYKEVMLAHQGSSFDVNGNRVKRPEHAIDTRSPRPR